MRRCIVCFLFLVLTATAAVPAVRADTHFVSTTGADSGDCTVTPCATIAYAIGQATAGDDVALEDGTYTESAVVNVGITIRGQGSGTTIVQAAATRDAATDRVFSVTAVSVTFEDLTVQHGNFGGEGGGIWVSGTGGLTLRRVVVRDNLGASGGGIGSRGSLTLHDTTVDDNDATSSGGGIYLTLGGTLQAYTSTISRNQAQFGGGVYFGSGAHTVETSTVSGNTATSTGGGVYVNSGSATLQHATVASNTGTTFGGGLYGNAGTTFGAQNTLVADNQAGSGGADCFGTIDSQGYNLIEQTASCTIDGDATGNVTGTDPMLAALADTGGLTEIHLLQAGSPAADAIPSLTSGCGDVFTLDQRGTGRPQNGTGTDACDVGAVEATADELPVELVSFSAAQDGEAVVLRWETASETGNAGFDVEQQTAGGASWARVAFVEGRGTTAEAQVYAHRLDGLAAGTYRFRLRQVDYDGAFAYGPEVEVAVLVPGAFRLSDVYPNPFNPQAAFTLTAALPQHVRVAVYDALGRPVALLFDGWVEAGHTYPFHLDGTRLGAGTYRVRATGETFSASRAAVLLK